MCRVSIKGVIMSRTYDTARDDRRGGGYDYGSKRLGNRHYLNSPGKYKSGKKKTHTRERVAERRLIHTLESEGTQWQK